MKLFLPLLLIAAIFAVACAEPERQPIPEPEHYDSPIQQNDRSGRFNFRRRVCNRYGYCRYVWFGWFQSHLTEL